MNQKLQHPKQTNPTKLYKDEQAKRDNSKEWISFKGGGNTRISKE